MEASAATFLPPIEVKILFPRSTLGEKGHQDGD
jgi:hypothetical protein